MTPIFVVAILALSVYWFFMSPYSQSFGPFPYKKRTSQKLVALTFDDGPNDPYTSEILKFLADKNIKATFFVVGKCALKYPEVVKSIERAGHSVGNHSYSHQFYKYLTQPSFKQELLASQTAIKSVIGKEPALFRPPWLWRQPLLFKSLKQLKVRPVSGEFCNILEVFQPSGKRIARRALAKLKPGAIIIFHDGFDAKGGNRAQTVLAVKLFVNQALNSGYKFVTVDQLIGIEAYKKV
jgi:peptidoglycan-N-acetylglucosamine deacetylase